MDIAEIRKKAKLLKDKLRGMEESIKSDTLAGRKALEDSGFAAEEGAIGAAKDGVPIETTPAAQKESNFKMAEALEMTDRDDRGDGGEPLGGLSEARNKEEAPAAKESSREVDAKPEVSPDGEIDGESCKLLTDEEAAEFEALAEKVKEEEALEAEQEKSGPAQNKTKAGVSQSTRLTNKLLEESLKAEIKLESGDSSSVMPDLLDIGDIDNLGVSDDEEADLSVFEGSDSKVEDGEKEVKKTAETSDVIKDSTAQEDDEDTDEDRIEWGMEEELDEVIDFEIEALIFTLGSEKYAMDIQILSEVIVSTDLIDVPRAPRGTEGLLSLRGQIIPVMDLMERLGLEGEPKKSRILILKDDEFFLGFYVDSVDDVIGFTADELEPSPTVTSIDSSLIESLGRHEGKPYIILNMNTILEKI